MSTSVAKRRVHFHAYDEIHEIESHTNFTKQEITSCWYRASQLRFFKKKRIEEASKWDAHNPSGFCIRGLEQYTPTGETSTEIERCVDAVMDVQDAQWSVGEDDYGQFAVVSQEISRFSVRLALLRAEQDELEAKRIYRLILLQGNRKSRKCTSSETSIVALGDDETSICSDLSHPEHSLTSMEDSRGRADDERNTSVVSEENNTPAALLSPSRSTLIAVKLKVKEIAEVLKTIHAGSIHSPCPLNDREQRAEIVNI